MPLNTKGYWIENSWKTLSKVWIISKDFYDLISSREPRLFSCTGSCKSWSTTEVQWTYKDGWQNFSLLQADLVNRCSTTSCPWRTTTESCRYCSSYSGCTSTCQRALEWRDVQTSPCTTQQCKTVTAETGIPFEWQFVSIEFCKSGRLDAGSKKHTDKHRDTSW